MHGGGFAVSARVLPVCAGFAVWLHWLAVWFWLWDALLGLEFWWYLAWGWCVMAARFLWVFSSGAGLI